MSCKNKVKKKQMLAWKINGNIFYEGDLSCYLPIISSLSSLELLLDYGLNLLVATIYMRGLMSLLNLGYMFGTDWLITGMAVFMEVVAYSQI